jgi:hypothetical protein
MSFNISKMKDLKIKSQEFKDLKEDKKVYVYLNYTFKLYRNKPIADRYNLKSVLHQLSYLSNDYKAVKRDWFSITHAIWYTLETGRIYGFQEQLIYNMKHKNFIDFIIKMHNDLNTKKDNDTDIGYYVPNYMLNNLKAEVKI